MSFSDALTSVSAIEQQVAQLRSGALLDAALGVSAGTVTAASGSATSFADELAAAGGAGSSAGDGGVPLGAVGAAAASSANLPSAAQTQLTSAQQQFASTLSGETGLSPAVVSAWLLAEESGSAAQARQAQNNNDWLNIGYTDSGAYGSTDSVWSNPVSAATATAQWLQGQDAIPGYGTASAGIQAIQASVGQTPEQQIQAIQDSGWSSGGYPSLPEIYGQLVA
ncbi:MAG: hypothetical protein ACP5H2_09270 [Solirubrobacteraceae bacterium]